MRIIFADELYSINVSVFFFVWICLRIVCGEPLKEQQHQPNASDNVNLFSPTSPSEWKHVLGNGSLKGFPSYAEATSLLESFLEVYQGFISRFRVGESFEGRPLWAYRIREEAAVNASVFWPECSARAKIGSHFYRPDQKQCLADPFNQTVDVNNLVSQLVSQERDAPCVRTPSTVITALHHAREPASLAVVLYFVGRILELGSSSVNTTRPGTHTREDNIAQSAARYLLKNHEIIVLPFVNPDGYVAIEVLNSFYIRKNRRPTCPEFLKKPQLQGVDLNRNYDYQFLTDHLP